MDIFDRLVKLHQSLKGELHIDLPLRQILVLLYLYNNGNTHLCDMYRNIGIPQVSASRCIKSLGRYRQKKGDKVVEKGLGLVWNQQDDFERRLRMVGLTDKGKQLMRSVFG